MGKQIPLVMYKSGIRTELGKVIVEDDGSCTGQVSREYWMLVQHLFKPGVGELSVNPAPENPVIHPKVREISMNTYPKI